MIVPYPLVLSVRLVVRLKGTRKRAEAESFGPSLLLGKHMNPKVLESANPIWCTQYARIIIATDTGAHCDGDAFVIVVELVEAWS